MGAKPYRRARRPPGSPPSTARTSGARIAPVWRSLISPVWLSIGLPLSYRHWIARQHVLLEPADDTCQVVETMGWQARAQHGVGFAGVTDELDLAARLLER